MQILMIPLALLCSALVAIGLSTENSSKPKRAALVITGLVLFVVGGEIIPIL